MTEVAARVDDSKEAAVDAVPVSLPKAQGICSSSSDGLSGASENVNKIFGNNTTRSLLNHWLREGSVHNA